MAAKTAWWPFQPHHYDRPLPLPLESTFVCQVQEFEEGAIELWVARKLADDGDYSRLIRAAAAFSRDGAAAAFTTVNWVWSDSTQSVAYIGAPWSLVVPEKAGIDGDAFSVSTRLKLKSMGLGTKLVLAKLPDAATLTHPHRTADLPAPSYYPFFAADPAMHVQVSDFLAEPLPVGPPTPDGGPVMEGASLGGL
jgi:hypothetical protein